MKSPASSKTPAKPSGKIAPGPPGEFILGNLRERRDRPLNFHLESSRKYGPVVRFKIGPLALHFIDEPALIKHVLMDNHRNYVKGFGYDKLHAILGDGLLTSEGDFWRRQRRLAQPAFHRQRIAGLADVMIDSTRQMLKGWEGAAARGESLDVAQEMMRVTLGIVSRTLLGTDVSGQANEVGQALTFLLADTDKRIFSIMPFGQKLPTPNNVRFKRHLKILNDVVYSIIEKRRHAGVDTGDLLSMLMLARDEESGESMSDRQIRDEVMTIFLAGHETTANTLAWTWVLLSRHPDVERRIRDELRSVVGDRAPGMEDLPKLEYLSRVIEEAMRLYPPAWVISRRAVAEDELGGYRIPARSLVVLSPFATQRNPKYWENPEGFDPDRFLPEREAARPKFAYFPFGGGPRMCIGSAFAQMEAQLILALTLQKFRLDLVPGHPIEPEALITLRPRHGVRVTLHAPRAADPSI